MCNICTFGDAIQGIGIGALFMKTFQFLVGTKVSKLWLACSVTLTRRYVTERKSKEGGVYSQRKPLVCQECVRVSEVKDQQMRALSDLGLENVP